jgi:hypothetical protein
LASYTALVPLNLLVLNPVSTRESQRLGQAGRLHYDKQLQPDQMGDYMYTFPCSGHQNACPTANTHAPV